MDDGSKDPEPSSTSRTAETAEAYVRRFNQLVAQARRAAMRETREISTQIPPKTLVDYLIAKRPGYSANSWRQMRASVSFAMQILAEQLPAHALEINRERARLRSIPAAPDPDRPIMTSRKKAKRVVENDMRRICHAATALGTRTGEELVTFLNAANLTGLRPCEWVGATLRRSAVSGFTWELVTRNAKSTNGRGNGPTRTLYWTNLPRALVEDVTNWIVIARQPGYVRRLGTLRTAMAKLTKSLFPRRSKKPTLYTPRHEATARWKAFYLKVGQSAEERIVALATVAALLGHGSDETANRHYGRPTRKSPGADLSHVPAADPAAIATVRQRLKLDGFGPQVQQSNVSRKR